MLFSVSDDTFLNDYFNVSNTGNYNNMSMSSNILSPKDGLNLGNLYADEYDSYKNYKPRELVGKTLQEQELLKIRQLGFAIIDLNLKLDVEPNNRELYSLFKSYNDELNDRIKDYSSKYNPLELCYDSGNSYDWYKNPWPWEGNINV